jgi:uncharacterized protein with PIN domain
VQETDADRVVTLAQEQGRILLTRGSTLPTAVRRLGSAHVYGVRANETAGQVAEILRAFRIEVCVRLLAKGPVWVGD